jgi:predicted NBD/HSP70 family sugar kinase
MVVDRSSSGKTAADEPMAAAADPGPTAARPPAHVRRQNLSTLLREVHVHGALSRSELGSRTGLNRSTIGSLVSELASRELVQESPPVERPGPGRPSPLVSPIPDRPVVLAVDVATDSLGVALIGIGGSIVSATRIDRQRGLRSPQSEVTAVAQLAAPFISSPEARASIVAIGVAVPGTVRRDDGSVHLAPNLGWHDVPIPDLIHDELQLDVPVVVGNDANLAALAEHTRGAGVGHDDFICLWGEAGIGAGIITGGRQLHGSVGYAGEVGHMTVNPQGLACHCGSRGCLETEVGEDALIRQATHVPWDGTRADIDELIDAAERGVPSAREAMASVGHWLGIGIAGLIDIFDPGAIALGGLYARLYPFLLQAMLEEVARRTIGTAQGPVAIVPVTLGADSALLGAAELALARTIADPTTAPRRDSRQRPARSSGQPVMKTSHSHHKEVKLRDSVWHRHGRSTSPQYVTRSGRSTPPTGSR